MYVFTLCCFYQMLDLYHQDTFYFHSLIIFLVYKCLSLLNMLCCEFDFSLWWGTNVLWCYNFKWESLSVFWDRSMFFSVGITVSDCSYKIGTKNSEILHIFLKRPIHFCIMFNFHSILMQVFSMNYQIWLMP